MYNPRCQLIRQNGTYQSVEVFVLQPVVSQAFYNTFRIHHGEDYTEDSESPAQETV